MIKELENKMIRSTNENEELKFNLRQEQFAVTLFNFAMARVKTDNCEQVTDLKRELQ